MRADTYYCIFHRLTFGKCRTIGLKIIYVVVRGSGEGKAWLQRKLLRVIELYIFICGGCYMTFGSG